MLRRYRRTSGLSQAALAERAGLSSEAVSLLERNLGTPRPATLTLLADALDLAAEERGLFFAVATGGVPPTHAGPDYLDRFFGRAAEIHAVVSRLRPDGPRLVTLTGPAGVGKTRLAAVVTGPAAGPTPVRWVRVVSDMTEPEFVAALGAALGVPSTAGTSLEAVADAVRLPPSVLVLDRADALLPSVRRACELLLARSQLRLVVTSRQRLRLGAEVVVPITPLPLPVDIVGQPAELTSDATRLFVDRSQAVRRTTAAATSGAEAAAVARICCRVDGNPLAIELAASLTSVLSVVELADALDQSLAMLSPPDDGVNRGLTRHLVADVYPRLGADEQQLLGRLSVFAGSFDLAAVLALHGTTSRQGRVVGTLASLISRSLVLRRDDPAGNVTFSLLQVVREFAEARLEESPDGEMIRLRHAHYFRDRAGEAGARLGERGSSPAAARLESEAADIRTAFTWCVEHDPESSLVLVASLWPWWHESGHYWEGRCRISAALQAYPSAPAHLKAPAFAAAGLFALLQSDYDDAQWHIQQGLDAYSAAEDGGGVCWTLALLGALARQRGEYTVADQLHSQSLILAQRANDAHAIGAQLNALSQVSWLRGDLTAAEDRGQRALESLSAVGDSEGITWALINLGVTARLRGDAVSATVLLRHSLELSEDHNYREGIAWSLNQLGVLARLDGDAKAALAQQTLSLAEHRRLGNRWRMASVHDELAALAAADCDGPRAVTHLGAADQLRREIKVPLPNAEQPAREETVAAARVLLGSGFSAATQSGMAGWSQPSAHALSVGAR